MYTTSLKSFFTRYLSMVGTVMLAGIMCSPSAAAMTINLKVFATGNLPDEGFIILQAVGDNKPLLPITDHVKKRGDVAIFDEDPNKPDYTKTVQVKNPKTFNMSYIQIENADLNSMGFDEVECRHYRWLKGFLDDYLAKHTKTTELDIEVYLNTNYIAGKTPDQNPDDPPNSFIDNSTCDVTFKINGISFP